MESHRNLEGHHIESFSQSLPMPPPQKKIKKKISENLLFSLLLAQLER